MPLHSKIMWAVCLVVMLVLAVHLLGVLPAVLLTALILGSFVRRVGWRRAIFPFTSHMSG